MCGHKGVKCPPGMQCRQPQTVKDYLNNPKMRREIRAREIQQAHRAIRRAATDLTTWTWRLIKAIVKP